MTNFMGTSVRAPRPTRDPFSMSLRPEFLTWSASNGLEASTVIQSFWSPFGEAEMLVEADSFPLHLSALRFEGIVHLTMEHGPLRFTPHKSKASSARSKWLTLERITEGIEYGESQSSSQPYDHTERDIILRDWNKPTVWERPSITHWNSFWIPSKLLPPYLVSHDASGRWSWADSHPLGLMLSTIWAAADQINGVEAGDRKQFLSGIVGLLSNVVPEKPKSKMNAQEVPAVASLMQDFVRTNLRDENLGVEQLVKAFRCSRSTVYRCFAKAGGVRAFILQARLEACRIDLRSNIKRGDTTGIAEVAFYWGFTDPAHFNRAFREAYGETPGSWLARTACGKGTITTSIPEALRSLYSWLDFYP